MTSASTPPAIAVLGAAGVVGRRVCAELARAGWALSIAGRTPVPLAALADTLPAARVHVADAGDAAALARAFAGVRVVVNAAGPLAETMAPVLVAALAAGAHYVDVGGEQAILHAVYERHESAVRHAGLVALPGAGLDGTVGDLAAAWAAAHLAGVPDPGEAVRSEPAPRLSEDHPLDDIAVSYVFDELALSAGSQRALFGALGTRALMWRRDRWEAAPAGGHRRINVGPALGGPRDAQVYAGGEVLMIPRHVAARLVTTYLSPTRRAGAATALRVLARALPLLPRSAGKLLVPYPVPEAVLGHTQLAVVAQVRHGFSTAQIVVRGHDLYRTTAAVTAWCASRLAERGAGPIGMRAPGELFRAEPALRAIASAADLRIEPSFG